MSSHIQKGSRHFDTIVIGAGTSGLACASRLLQQQAFKRSGSLLVLEGRDRIGGRVNSVYVNGNRLDTGANWIHGIGTEDEPNPLMKVLPHKRYKQLAGFVAFQPPKDDATNTLLNRALASSEGWEDLARNYNTEQQSNTTTGDLVIPPESAETLMNTVWGTIGSIHEQATSLSADEAKRTTTLNAIRSSQFFRDAFKTLPPKYHKALGAMPQFVESMEAAPLAAQSAEHSQDRSGMSLLEYSIEDFDGEQVFLQDGYIAIVEELAEDLKEAGVIKLGEGVQEVHWDKDPIEVRTSNDTYTTKTVVCTMPLGVLKQHQDPEYLAGPEANLFTPKLPKEKVEAISSLGFGTLDKIFLVYPRPWWTEEPFLSILKKGYVRRPFEPTNDEETWQAAQEKDAEADSFMGFTHELPGIEIDGEGNVSSGARMLTVINLHSLTGFPVLSSFVSCSNGVQVEAMSDEDAGNLVHRALTSWLGREPPKPQAVHVTRWAQDRFSKGSYSHMITNVSETRHRETFQEPIRGSNSCELRFAGEHTSRNHFATVHGALLSGWREADAILQRQEKHS